MKDRVRKSYIQSRVEASRIAIKMVSSGVSGRIREVLVHIIWLVLHILSHLVIVASILTVDLRHKVPSLRLIEFSHPYYILFVDFVCSRTMGFMTRGGIIVSDIANLVIFKETIHQQIFLLELIRF